MTIYKKYKAGSYNAKKFIRLTVKHIYLAVVYSAVFLILRGLTNGSI